MFTSKLTFEAVKEMVPSYLLNHIEDFAFRITKEVPDNEKLAVGKGAATMGAYMAIFLHQLMETLLLIEKDPTDAHKKAQEVSLGILSAWALPRAAASIDEARTQMAKQLGTELLVNILADDMLKSNALSKVFTLAWIKSNTYRGYSKPTDFLGDIAAHFANDPSLANLEKPSAVFKVIRTSNNNVLGEMAGEPAQILELLIRLQKGDPKMGKLMKQAVELYQKIEKDAGDTAYEVHVHTIKS